MKTKFPKEKKITSLLGIGCALLIGCIEVSAKKPATAGNGNGNGNGNSGGSATGGSSTNGGETVTEGGDTTSGETNGNKESNGKGNGGSGGDTSGSSNTFGTTDGTTTYIHLPNDYSVPGNINIVGPTVILAEGDFDIGNNQVNIGPNGSLVLYAAGNISVNGNGGFNNTQVPSKLIINGLHPEKNPGESPDYSITLSGNGFLSGVVYAPNAKYVSNGGGNSGATLGSIVALEIRFNGSPGPFHFDEALKNIETPFGGYKLDKYKLLKNGKQSPSATVETVVGTGDYKSLFDSLFSKTP